MSGLSPRQAHQTCSEPFNPTQCGPSIPSFALSPSPLGLSCCLLPGFPKPLAHVMGNRGPGSPRKLVAAQPPGETLSGSEILGCAARDQLWPVGSRGTGGHRVDLHLCGWKEGVGEGVDWAPGSSAQPPRSFSSPTHRGPPGILWMRKLRLRKVVLFPSCWKTSPQTRWLTQQRSILSAAS